MASQNQDTHKPMFTDMDLPSLLYMSLDNNVWAIAEFNETARWFTITPSDARRQANVGRDVPLAVAEINMTRATQKIM